MHPGPVEPHASTRGSGVASYAPTDVRKPDARVVKPCPPSEPEPPPTCCDLVCFERPRYFCGHLLTDEDLTTEQRYVIEKHKLYHRALHGHGVVCGVRLTCDPRCPGHVIVGEGYAIDDCGNDLVVCEPRSFDVVALLREKRWLGQEKPPDPCEEKKEEPACKIRQCFYVTICYQEEGYEFTTPFVAGCRPTLTECEPTRIRERVRFDVLDQLPKRVNPLDELGARLKECFTLVTEGPFAAASNDPTVIAAVNGSATAAEHEKFCEAFCKLRGLFLLYLSKHPDHYNCTLEKDVRDICCPDPTDTSKPYGAQFQDTFRQLIELVYQHVMSCVCGELTVPCEAPSQASCVLLGTVEIEEGRVVRVCNCPRWYVWSFASFVQVLIATLLGQNCCEEVEAHVHDTRDPAATHLGRATGLEGPTRHDQKEPPKETCCREFKLQDQGKAYFKSLRFNRYSTADVATAVLATVRSVASSLQSAFDFTKQDFVSPGRLLGMKVADLNQFKKDFDVDVRIEDYPAEFRVPDPVMAFQAGSPMSAKDLKERLVFYQQEGVIVAAGPREPLQAQIDKLQQQIETLKAQIPERPPHGGQGGPTGTEGTKPKPRRPGGSRGRVGNGDEE